MMRERTHEVAKALLDIQAVSLKPADPFVWTSGLKSPIYCDNRLIMSFPEVRSFIEEELVALIKTQYPEVDLIAGTATAGIPHAAIVADRMNLPMIYVRSSSKGHGKKNAIEGQVSPGQKVVMVEDLISTGKSVIEAADKVEEAGGDVIGAVAIFSYELQEGHEAFEKQTYGLNTLTSYPELIEFAVQSEELLPYKETLNDWYKDPVKWSEQAK
jgi:orotate phosphoribosyltransferase